MPAPAFHLADRYAPLWRDLALSPEAIFTDPRITVWRDIPERQNCTLDAGDTRLHVKRYSPVGGSPSPAEEEARGIRLLEENAIPTTPLVAWSNLADGRCFVITEDLSGYRAADKLLAAGAASFADLLTPTADLAARLHAAGLHHRDLYLCHFFVKTPAAPIHLIDAARVARLPRFLTRRRWIVKDLAQFWYSTHAHPDITDAQRDAWLDRYRQQRGLSSTTGLRKSIVRKSDRIRRHDARLNSKQPTRNVSIPET
ncbi:MAG: lipopolysaccharide kinase InaA family protein [Phycisphaerae bacterium]|nr:lipopolysaccharide kinase InaA family protein [Tepidisphaeraceae bacterium]